jgi:hypothetical protein
MRDRDHWGNTTVDGRIFLRWILKWNVGGGGMTELCWLKIEMVAGTCECGNEPSGSIKCGEFID